MRKLFFIFCLLSIFCFAETGLPANLLKNGGFEEGRTIRLIPKHWGDKSYNQSVINNPFGKDFGKCLKIARKKSGYSIGAQIIDIDQALGNTLVVSGYWQGKNIKINKENWNGAKVQIIFYDQNEKEIGQPQDIAHNTKDFNWQMFIKNILIPQNAAKAKVLLGLWDAAGEVIFDELQLYAVKSNSGSILQNGDLETWGSWEFLGEGKSEIRQPGYGQGSALYIQNSRPDWTFGAQVISITAERKYKLSGLVDHKTIVSGRQEWQKGRVYAEYFNAQMNKVGGIDALQYFDGSSNGWKRFNAEFTPPKNARFAKLYFGLQNCTGEIAFDNLDVK